MGSYVGEKVSCARPQGRDTILGLESQLGRAFAWGGDLGLAASGLGFRA